MKRSLYSTSTENSFLQDHGPFRKFVTGTFAIEPFWSDPCESPQPLDIGKLDLDKPGEMQPPLEKPSEE